MDVFHSISKKPRVKCEECGSSCRRLLGMGSGVIFKGSGFYETDYKNKSGKPSEKSESTAKNSDGDGKKSDGNGSKKESAKSTGSTESSGSKSSAAKD